MIRRSEISDAELARLLSGRNELSVLEREQMRERVVAATTSEPRSWFLRLQPLAFGALSTAAAVAIGVFAFRGLLDRPEPLVSGQPGGIGSPHANAAPLPGQSAGDVYTARGAALVPSLELACIGPSGTGHCARGRKLTFTVRGEGEWRHFGAFARAADGTIYWYFPGVGASGIEIDVERATVLDRAIVLGDEAAGPVTVYGVFSRVPLTRDGIKRAVGPELAGDGTVTIVKHQLPIEEDE